VRPIAPLAAASASHRVNRPRPATIEAGEAPAAARALAAAATGAGGVGRAALQKAGAGLAVRALHQRAFCYSWWILSLMNAICGVPGQVRKASSDGVGAIWAVCAPESATALTRESTRPAILPPMSPRERISQALDAATERVAGA